jgi:AcrR family transcriptional regulator
VEVLSLVDRLREVAHHLLDTEGPASLTVRRLATAAEIAPMSIYNHFGSKDGVVDRLVMDGYANLRTELEALPAGNDPLDDLRRGCAVYRRLALARPHLYAVMFERAVPGFEPSTQCWQVAVASFDVLVQRVRAGQEAGLLMAGPTVPLAEQMWSALHGMVTLELHGLGFAADRDRQFADTIDTMLRGLAVS